MRRLVLARGTLSVVFISTGMLLPSSQLAGRQEFSETNVLFGQGFSDCPVTYGSLFIRVDRITFVQPFKQSDVTGVKTVLAPDETLEFIGGRCSYVIKVKKINE